MDLMGRAVAVLIALGASAVPTPAQQGSPLPPTLTSDSVAWERVVVHVTRGLATHLVRTAHDTTAQPWRITLPPDVPDRALVERQLRTILRARSVLPEDSVTYELTIFPLEILADTARTTVRTAFKRRCPGTGQVTGFGNSERVMVPRHPRGFWGVARSGGIAHGDRLGCDRPSR